MGLKLERNVKFEIFYLLRALFFLLEKNKTLFFSVGTTYN